MPKKEPKSPMDMIVGVLRHEEELFLSAAEIRENIIDHYAARMNAQSIHRRIEELNQLMPGSISIKVVRIGPKKVPVRLYAILQSKKTQQ